MGIRCSQSQGLPDNAIEFLLVSAVRINECPYCQRHDGYQREVIGTYGVFNECNLYRYTLSDGSTANEYVQQEVLNAELTIWIALRWKDVDFRWLPEIKFHELDLN